MILLGGLAIPLHGFHKIFLHAPAILVAVAQFVLSFGVILLSGPAIPRRRFGIIPIPGAEEAQFVLSFGVILLGGLAKPLRCLTLAFRHAIRTTFLSSPIPVFNFCS